MFNFTSTLGQRMSPDSFLRHHFLPGLILVLMMAGCQQAALAYTIATTTSSVSFCSGATISIGYSISGSGAPTSGNVFTAQLSNASGSFASPFSLGTVNSTSGNGSISVVVPSSILSGSGYRVRVVSSAPAVNGSDNGANISINMLQPLNTVFSESLGTVTTNTNVSTLENNNGFDNDGYTMTSSSNSNVYLFNGGSSGYSGASGSGALFFDGNGNFMISGINSASLSNMQICFAIKKTSNSFTGSGFTVSVSANGTSWTDLTYALLPTGTGTSNPWYVRYATGNIPATSNLRIRFLRSGGSDFYIDDIKLLSPGSAVSPTISPSSAQLSCGGSTTLSATSIAGASYLWSNGATSSSINVSTPGNYSVTVTDFFGCAATTSAVPVSYSSPLIPAVTISSDVGTNVCDGNTVVFTASPVNGGSSPSYQWKVNGANVGTNSSTYSTNSMINGQVVSCVMTSNAACVNNATASSNELTLSVTTPVNPSVSIALTSGSNPLCDSSPVTFTATPVNGGSSPNYQWKIDGSNVGSNSATFSSSSFINGQIVTCELTSSLSCVYTSIASSNGIVMFVSNGATASIAIEQTAGTNPMCEGTHATFTAQASNAISPVYQWKINGAPVGSNGTTFTTADLTADDIVSCELKSAASCPSILTLGTGTSTNIATNDLGAAYPTYYGSGRQQWIVRASELQALGLSAGELTSIGFQVAELTGDPETLNGYTIKIAQTNVQEATNTFLSNGFTTVFGPVNYTPALNTLNAHYFDSPFVWDGTSNLCIDICFSNQVVGTAAYKTYRTASSFTSCTYYEVDGAAGANACSQATGWTTNFRPNMTFTVGGTVATYQSNAIAMSVSDGGGAQITIAQTGGSNPLCEGSEAIFTATVQNATSPTYQWKLNGNDVGTNSNVFSSSALNENDIISCVLVSAEACPSIGKIGYGNTTNTTTSDLGAAYPTYYGNGRQQWIILASELEAMGLTAGYINAIGFDVSGTTGNPNVLNGYTIKIGQTSESSANGVFFDSGFTTVFGPVNYTPAINTLNVHTFTSPFEWDGLSNICLDICFSNEVIGYAAYRTFMHEAEFNSSVIYESDGDVNFDVCSVANGWVNAFRPNTYFYMDSNTNSVLSNNIIIDESPVVTSSVSIALTSGNNPACLGESLTFTATPVNGGDAPTYQWKVDGLAVGTNNSQFTSSSLSNGQTVSCEMSSNLACASQATVSSSGITVQMNSRPSAILSGTQSACPGEVVNLTATLNGNGPWFGTLSDGTNFTANASPVVIPVTVSTNATYTISTLNDMNCAANANDLTGSALVNANDAVAPIAVCQNVTVQLDGSGHAHLTPEMVDNGSTDNCAIASLSLSETTFDCSDLGGAAPFAAITSDQGYQVNIEVEAVSVTPASLSCQWGYNYTVQLSYHITFSGSNIPSELWTLQGTIGCGSNSLFFDLPNNGGTGTVSTSQSWTSANNCADATLDLLGCGQISIELNGPGISTQTVNLSVPSNTTTLTVLDANGNSASCVANVTVVDINGPELICPESQTMIMSSSCSFELPDYRELAVLQDNCSDATFNNINQYPAPGTLVNGVSVTTVNMQIEDAAGNQNTCLFTVTSFDHVEPVVACPADQNLNMDESGYATIPNYIPLLNLNDNCDAANLVVEQMPVAGTSVNGSGSTEVSFIIHDQSGNIAICSFNAIHVDVTAPTITCIGNQELIADGVGVTMPDYTSLMLVEDNMSDPSNISFSQNPLAGQLLSAGVLQVVSVTATDESGNSSTCTFDVIVQEQTKLTFSSGTLEVSETDGQLSLEIQIENPSPIDPVTLNVTLASGDASRVDGFTQQSITFPAGSNDAIQLNIPLTNNSICDLTNEIQIGFANIEGGYNAAAGTIAVLTVSIDDDETIDPLVFTENGESSLSSLWRMSSSGSWGVSSSQPIAGSGSIRHISNGTSGTSWISRDLTHLPITGVTTDWRFNVNHFGHDPNQNDAFLVYLGATAENPAAEGVQGYALGVLPTSDADPDIIKLYRTLSGIPVQTIASTGYDLNSTDQVIGWSVVRSDQGTWFVYMDQNGGFDNLTLMCSGIDQTISRAEYFSVWYRNASNTAGQLAIDDISVQQTACQCTYYTRASGDASQVIWSLEPNGTPVATEMSQYKNVIVQSGHTLSLQGELITKDFQVNSGGTYNAGSSEIISYGNVALNGNFQSQNGMITLRGETDHTISSSTGSLTFNHLKVDAPGHLVSLPTENETYLKGVAWIPTGTLLTHDKLTLISNAQGTASIGTIGNDGSLSGEISLQRFIPNLTNYPYGAWLNLSCPVQGCTIQDWNDDIITTGFAGSDYPPPYSFNNISWYNEPTAGGFNSGYQYATNVNNPLYSDRGYFVYMQSAAQLPVVKGEIYQHDFNKNLSYTNTGNASGDGWNLLANQYPSEIDFRQMALNGNGVSSYSIYDAEISNYRTYNAVTNVGNASRYIASSQSFFVKASATGAYLKFREVFKSFQGVAFERDETDVNESPFISFKLKAENGSSDEAVLAIHDNASDAYDVLYDAPKLYSPVSEAAGCALVSSDNQELSIYCRQEPNAEINIPIYLNLPLAGTYSFEVFDLSNIDNLACIFIEDVVTGQHIPMSAGEVLQIQTDQPFSGNRLRIRSGSAVTVEASDVSCFGEANGLILFNNISPSAEIAVSNANGQNVYHGSAIPYIDHVPAGNYHVIISDEDAGCPVTENDIVVTQPLQPSVILQSATPANCSDGVNGMLSVEVEHIADFTYHLVSSSGEEIRTGHSNEELLIFDDIPGDIYTLTIDERCGAHSMMADVNDPDAVKVLILSDDIFVSIVQGGSQSIYVEQESTNASDFIWSLSNGYESNSADFQYAFFEEGKFSLELSGHNDRCEDEDQISIIVEKSATGEDGFVPVSMAVSQSFLMFTMNQNLSEDVAFTIHDARGQLIWSIKTGMQQGKQIETGLSHLAAGVYFVNAVIEGKTILNRKIVKQ